VAKGKAAKDKDKERDEDQSNTTGRWLRRLTRGEPRDREELVEQLAEASRRGVIDNDALSMLEGVMEVSEMQVRDIMVPRSAMVVIQRDDSPDKILPLVVESGHSRYPVIGEDRDQVFGILLAKDLLKLFAEAKNEEFEIREFLRPAVIVPESKRLNVLLKEFRVSHNHMAIVVDEYGGVAGLVTIEDVIEQIVGEIDDEYDVEDDQLIRRDSSRQFSVRAVTRIPEFNEYFGTEFDDEEYDTVGGLVTHELGRLPRRGEALKVEGIEFRVLRADRRRIETLRITMPRDIPPRPEEEVAAAQ
jgi:magnesium and cobalt transporter